ncbi:tetratricopeptide repeat protein [Aerosakkonema funiforme]|uniref:tetratricopeptide repeat protein n=1 Tax=Aerosakkonema funiforme TaxID=1246630 RepID=UPI0035B8CECF
MTKHHNILRCCAGISYWQQAVDDVKAIANAKSEKSRGRLLILMASHISLIDELSWWNNVIRAHPYNAKAYIRRGMANFKLAEIDRSIQDFDTAEKLDPSVAPYLWQRGLSFYYAERFVEGANQFELDLTVNSQDVEETVWRYLCIARWSGAIAARNSLLVVKNDPRLVMNWIYELYAGNRTPDDVLAAGEKEGNSARFYSHLYVGLYYESETEQEKAQKFITKAAQEYQLDDYMWYLANVHQQLRGWS